MERTILPILVALAAALFVWGVIRVAVDLFGSDRRRLHERLRSDRRSTDAEVLSVRLDLRDEGLGRLLGNFSFARNLQSSLLQSFPELSVRKFLTIAAGCGFGALALVTLLTASPFVGVVAGVLGFFAPFLVVTNRRNRRQRMLVDQLPDALDFLGRALKAGHSFSTGLQMMGDELPQPLAAEFRRAYDQHSVGLPIEDCLRDMVRRIDSTDFAFFITATLIQRQTGGDLSEVLNNISGMIRQRIRLQQHVKAKTAEGRFTGYILAVFPVLMFVISYTLNPQYGGILLSSSTGIGLLVTAFTMTLLGLWLIRKLTTVRV